MMRVSVIMPAFNGEGWIGEQLAALASQTYRGEWELIVADNGSTDGTRGVASSWSHRVPTFRLIDASAVRGVAHARNQGAAAASGDALLIADVDDIVGPDWIALLSDGLLRTPIVTGPVAHFVDGRNPSRVDHTEPRERFSAGPFPYPIGCNMGIKREVLTELGGFDETLTLGCEDVDLGIRAALRGYSIELVEDAIVLRRRPGSARAMWRKEFAYGRGWTVLERRYPQISPSGWVRPLLGRAGWVALRVPYIAFDDRRRGWVVKAAGVAGRFAERVRPSA